MPQREIICSAVRIAIRPMALAEVAGRLKPRSALFVGVLGASLGIVMPLAAMAGAAGEPYPGLREYLIGTLIKLPFVYFLLDIPFWMLVFGGVLLASVIASSQETRFRSKVYALAPLTVLLPALLWSPGAALNLYSHPNMGYYGPAGRPVWLDSPIIDIWGSPVWILVLLAVATGFAIHAARRFDEFPEDAEFPTCAVCSYHLNGNVSVTCPECAKAVEASGDRASLLIKFDKTFKAEQDPALCRPCAEFILDEARS